MSELGEVKVDQLVSDLNSILTDPDIVEYESLDVWVYLVQSASSGLVDRLKQPDLRRRGSKSLARIKTISAAKVSSDLKSLNTFPTLSSLTMRSLRPLALVVVGLRADSIQSEVICGTRECMSAIKGISSFKVIAKGAVVYTRRESSARATPHHSLLTRWKLSSEL